MLVVGTTGSGFFEVSFTYRSNFDRLNVTSSLTSSWFDNVRRNLSEQWIIQNPPTWDWRHASLLNSGSVNIIIGLTINSSKDDNEEKRKWQTKLSVPRFFIRIKVITKIMTIDTSIPMQISAIIVDPDSGCGFRFAITWAVTVSDVVVDVVVETLHAQTLLSVSTQ